MKKGMLIYDSSTNRFDVLYEEGNSYGGLPCFYIQSQKGGTRHAEMPVQIPMGQAAQESFAGRQGNHGLLGKAGLTGGISQGSG